MLKLTYCLHRLPSLTREEFQRYWREEHAPLVKAAAPHLGIARYIQCHTEDHPLIAASAAARGIESDDSNTFDGVAEIWIGESDEVNPSAEAARHAAILLEDEGNFIDFTRSRMFATRENVVIE